MISSEEFTRRWGKDVLRRPSAEMFADVRLPDDQKQFLLDVGFPQCSYFNVEYCDLSRGLRRLSVVDQWKPSYQGDWDRLLLIGFVDAEIVVCLDEADNGKVVGVTSWMPRRDLLNTSVIHLAKCLLAYREVEIEMQSDELTKEQVKHRFKRFRDAIRVIDPAVLEMACDDGGIWSCVLEEMSYGVI